MKIFLSITLNGLILYAIQYFLPEIVATGGWKLYFVGGVVLGLLNLLVRPVLKLIGFPFMIITFGLFILVINAVIILLLEKIILLLNIPNIAYSTGGIVNFTVAVVIFTVFNTLYGVFFKK